MKRNRTNDSCKSLIIVASKLLLVITQTVIYGFVWFSGELALPFSARGNWVLLGVYVVLLYVFTTIYGGYNVGTLKRFDLIYSQLISLFFVNVITYFQNGLMMRNLPSVTLFLMMSAAEIVLIVIWSLVMCSVYKKLYPPDNMIVVYGDHAADSLIFKMNSRKDKYTLRESICIDVGIDNVIEKINKFDAVVLCDVPSMQRNKLLKYCYENSIRAFLSPKITDIFIRSAATVDIFDSPLLLAENKGLTVSDRIIKRTCDIILSLVFTILLFPFMIIIAVAIKIEDRGPIFFKQKRYTRNEKIFEIYKFRSMIVDAEKDGIVAPTTTQDPRVTRVGRVIRSIRFDELPQLLNILKGDMSFVGPRPERVEHVDKYSQEIPEFKYRLKVKGGLTGYAQVMGKYNTTAYDKLRFDLMYIEQYSFVLDLKLMLLTVKMFFNKESTEGIEDGSFYAEDLYSGKFKNDDTSNKDGDL